MESRRFGARQPFDLLAERCADSSRNLCNMFDTAIPVHHSGDNNSWNPSVKQAIGLAMQYLYTVYCNGSFPSRKQLEKRFANRKYPLWIEAHWTACSIKIREPAKILTGSLMLQNRASAPICSRVCRSCNPAGLYQDPKSGAGKTRPPENAGSGTAHRGFREKM